MSIRRRETKNGVVWDVKLRDPTGRMYQRTFRTKTAAKTYKARELADRSRGSWIDPRKSAVTFTECAAQWLTSNPAKRATGWSRDETIIRLHLNPVLGQRAVGSITRNDVQTLVNGWTTKKAARTVRRQYGVLRAIFNHAVDEDLIARSPCRRIKLPAVEQRQRHVISAAELAALGDAVGDNYRPMVYLGAVLGLRWGECAGLRIGRLDLLRGTLTVAEQRTRGLKGSMADGPPKSHAGRRTLSVPAPLVAMLAEHASRRGLTGADAEAYLFTTPDGRPLDYGNFRHRIWLPACRSVGLDGLGFHDLRRANATGMVADGVDVKTAQARLGHSDPTLTLALYAQATSEGDRAAAEHLGARFMPPTDPQSPGKCGTDVG